MLVSLADMKEYLGITVADYDDFLTQQIETISEAIEAYCSRKFEEANYTQYFYKEDFAKYNMMTDSLMLYHFPVTIITSVKEKNTEIEAGISVTDIRVNKPTAKINRRQYQSFFCNGDIVEVVYSAGFAEIPFTIQNAVYSLVAERYNKKKAGIDLNFGSDVQSISIPGTITVAYDYSLQDNERSSAFGSILGKYVNTLDYFRSERTLIGKLTPEFVE